MDIATAVPPEDAALPAEPSSSLASTSIPAPAFVWSYDCKGDAKRNDLLIRGHVYDADFRWTVSESPLTLIGGAVEDLSDEPILSGDIDGDGAADLILRSSSRDALLRGRLNDGEPQSSSIALELIPQSGGLHTRNGFVLQGSAGGCGRFLVREANNRNVKTISWKNLRGVPPDPGGIVDEYVRPLHVDLPFPHLIQYGRRDTPLTHIFFNPESGWQTAAVWPSAESPSGKYLGEGRLRSFGRVYFSYKTSSFGDREIQYNDGQSLSLNWLPLGGDPDIYIGDFVGDGTTGFLLLLPSQPLPYVMLAVQAESGPIYRSVPGLAERLSHRSIVGVADYDGDGRTDLLVRTEKQLSLIRFGPVPPSILPEVRINGTLAPVRGDGSFQLALSGAESATIAPSSDAFAFSPRRISVDPTPTRTETVGFAARRTVEAGGGQTFFRDFRKAPYTCIGYNGLLSIPWGRVHFTCPDGYGIVEIDDFNIPQFSCCRLPEDLLRTEATRWEPSLRCGPNELATGFGWLSPQTTQVNREPCPHCKQAIRCTSINSADYVLSEAKPGHYWGEGTSSQDGVLHIPRASIPNGLRQGVGRLSWNIWDEDGCMSDEWGALLTGGGGKRCAQQMFARVMPRAETKIDKSPLFPFRDCEEGPDPYDPGRDCK